MEALVKYVGYVLNCWNIEISMESIGATTPLFLGRLNFFRNFCLITYWIWESHCVQKQGGL